MTIAPTRPQGRLGAVNIESDKRVCESTLPMKNASESVLKTASGKSSRPSPPSGHHKTPSEAVGARHQGFGFAAFGLLALIAAVLYTRWDPADPGGRWFWIIVGPIAGSAALFHAHRRFSGIGVDRDASPYFGLFGGAVFGSVVLAASTVEGWVLTGIFFAVAIVLTLMARVERSTIGMTAAVSIAMLAAATGASGLDSSVGWALTAIGLMWISAAGALSLGRPSVEPAG